MPRQCVATVITLMGMENARLFEYYASRQPHRAVYRLDEEDFSLQFLGYARDLANTGRLVAE